MAESVGNGADVGVEAADDFESGAIATGCLTMPTPCAKAAHNAAKPATPLHPIRR
jgi:hypothetical protein